MSAPEITRESCAVCGMVANLDPSLHHQRYRHLPRVRRDGELWEFSYRTYAFTQKVNA